MKIIAEIGQNHNGDMVLARELIAAAHEAGADVAKFQIFDAHALFPREGNPWFDYNCKTELSRDQVHELAAECSKANIEFMASVFDVQRVTWTEEVGMKSYKIASRSVTDSALLKAVAATGKPILVSLGMWHRPEFPAITAPGGVHFLYCISKYPTPLEDLHLKSVDFTRYAGFSDHTIGLSASMAALALGAGIIEKHFTLDKSMYGPDHSGGMTPGELKQLTTFRDDLAKAL